MVAPDQPSPSPLLISPHLDDAVLSCGRFMAIRRGCSVLTALAGSPSSWDELTAWDAECGFSPGDDVVSARLSEDRRALAVLDGRQRTCDGLDSQYGPQEDRTAIVRSGIESALADLQPSACLVPLGLQHEDHIDTRRIALLVAESAFSSTSWIAYEDLPYGSIDRDNEHHAGALAAFAAAGFALIDVELELDATMDTKVRAVEEYSSQLLALRRYDPAFDRRIVAERYWRMSRS